MQKAAGHILKSSEVRLEGQIRLDPRCLSAQARGYPRQGGGGGPDSVGPQPEVRILESHPEFAVIEVICCCGARTYVKCQYADLAAGQSQRAGGQVSEQPSA